MLSIFFYYLSLPTEISCWKNECPSLSVYTKITHRSYSNCFVFLWNPGSQNYEFVLQDKMLLTTFLVGATAIIDFISTLIFLIEGTLTEIKNENENIDIKQLENRIDELEVKLATIKTPEHSSVNNIEHLSTKENSLSSSKCDK